MPVPDRDPLITQTRLRQIRRDLWLREGDVSVGLRPAQMGVLGDAYACWTAFAPWLAAQLGETAPLPKMDPARYSLIKV